jgi:hypothetical protein
LALPFTVFSIYYQWRIAKQWCRLCLSVQAILISETFAAFWGGLFKTDLFTILTPYKIAEYSLFLLLPTVTWLLIRPVLIQAREGKKSKRELLRLINNPQVFRGLLQRQKKIEYDPSGLGITLGNPTAKNKIVKVCNPYCGPCSAAHTILEELLHTDMDLQIQIIFSINDENDKRSLTIKHFLAIADKNDPVLLQHALNDWYSAPAKDYELFSEKYKLNGEIDLQTHKLAAMKDWCTKVEIIGTPTFFINGFQLPELFSVRDLKLFLPN